MSDFIIDGNIFQNEDYNLSSQEQLIKENPIFSREGYEISSWNSKPDGSGQSFDINSTVYMDTTKSFYAQWKPKTYHVIYNSNHNDGIIECYIAFSGHDQQILTANVYITNPKNDCNIYFKTGYSEQLLTGNTKTFNTSDTGVFSFVVKSDGYNDYESDNYRFTRTETPSEKYTSVESSESKKTKRVITNEYITAEKNLQENGYGRKGIALKDYTSEWYSITRQSLTSLNYDVKWGTWEQQITYKWSNVI